ncbi:ankyrin repeat protein, putative [Trichomonas vaginalis G3]|uniref:Ankyrin repeat protein, putative n=1 Tax=Trichomonas vaginalis (strain ATCC PRA-98 / G3) TaxID=412133 RepID=A2DP08_TRIV3|nr:protein ubiquitination [Trichomonas vaginalis G3]EAY17857.1 ankyrin repeat protein, putative [Trichomonas vaginalis G3]KAI5489943.1 protein ubiquitination [Trichomonas vaginalis G3]|eukprot:XP_001329992.1 ankyrin repeat protein [Trichomonas vaginalis G3]
MEDDIEAFIGFTEKEDFDAQQKYPCRYFWCLSDSSFLELCCYFGSVQCFKLLRTKFKSEITHKCLLYSFLSGKPDIMSECLKVIKPDSECMYYAIFSHNIDFITFLMNEFNIKVDLGMCVAYNNIQAFFVYLDQTGDINTCLTYSPKFNSLTLVKYLINNGGDVPATNSCYMTALGNAVSINSLEISELLIKHGADVNSKNQYGIPILHYCDDSIEMLNLFINSDANLDIRDEDGNSVLHFLCTRFSLELIEVLIANGVDIDARSNCGNTPLISAASCNEMETAKILINLGADINAANDENYTALDYARQCNNKEFEEFLISHGGKSFHTPE